MGDVTLFLCGDVMTGRGIDQVLAHPSRPELHEGYVHDAKEYVRLAERAHGPIGRRRGAAYLWGDLLDELAQRRIDARIANLETAVTTSNTPWRDKPIHYRMHPANVGCLAAAGIDCCVLANNHVLDWGRDGLRETLAAVRDAGIATAGAGEDRDEAAAPAAIGLGGARRILVFGYALASSGVPEDWAADGRPGVNFVASVGPESVRSIARDIARYRRQGDVVVASIHWGGNWGYEIGADERRFAHALVEDAGVDVVHGHSSHHPKGVEVHAGRPILYGCGDLVNDYEGIRGYEDFQPDVRATYFVTLDAATGRLVRLEVAALRARRFRLEHASPSLVRWLAGALDHASRRLGSRFAAAEGGCVLAEARQEALE